MRPCRLLMSCMLMLVTNMKRATAAVNANDLARMAGIIYYTGFDSQQGHWGIPSGANSWGEPLLSWYISSDPRVLMQHTDWMLRASLDFVVFDFTNQMPCVLGCVAYPCKCGRTDLDMIFDAAVAFVDLQLARKRSGAQYLKWAVMIGPGDDPQKLYCARHLNGGVTPLVQQVMSLLFSNNRLEVALFLDNKPLLLWWLNNCDNSDMGIPFGADPPVGQQLVVGQPVASIFTTYVMDNGISGRRQGIIDPQCATLPMWGPEWGWVNMLEPTKGLWMCRTNRWAYTETNSPVLSYAVDDFGQPLAQTIQPGIRGCAGWNDPMPDCASTPKNNGDTLVNMFRLAGRRSVKIALVTDWNSWSLGESLDIERSNTIEPSMVQGNHYLNILGLAIEQWKAYANAN